VPSTDAGVVHDHVQGTEGFHRAFHQAAHIPFVCNVGSEGDGPPSGLLDLVHHCLGSLHVQVGYGDVSTLGSEPTGHVGTNATSSPCDDDHFRVKPSHYVLSCLGIPANSFGATLR